MRQGHWPKRAYLPEHPRLPKTTARCHEPPPAPLRAQQKPEPVLSTPTRSFCLLFPPLIGPSALRLSLAAWVHTRMTQEVEFAIIPVVWYLEVRRWGMGGEPRIHTDRRAGVDLQIRAWVCTFRSAREISVDSSPRPLAGEGTAKRGVRDSVIVHEENNPSAPASPCPLPSDEPVFNCGPVVNPNVEAPDADPKFCASLTSGQLCHCVALGDDALADRVKNKLGHAL